MTERPEPSAPGAEPYAFRTDLYRGTAPYYDRYRPAYPQVLLDDLCARLPVTGRGRLLDLACGTGQIAIPLARHFAEVVAVDQEPETVAFGRARATASGVRNVDWVVGAAERVHIDGAFELVTVGTAFHRLDRWAVAQRVRSWVEPGAGVALVWCPMPWEGTEPWQEAMMALFVEWLDELGAHERIPASWERAMRDESHAQVLERAGFAPAGTYAFTVSLSWTVESLTGFLYSTSVLNRSVLGARAGELERDLAGRLAAHLVDRAVRQSATFTYELARAPTP